VNPTGPLGSNKNHRDIDGGGKTLEFKRDLSSPDGILKCMVAFANAAGGIIIIGVEDGTKPSAAFEMVSRRKRSLQI